LKLSKSERDKIPDIIFILKNIDDEHDIIEMTMPTSHYVDDLGNGKYAFRIYLTEASGGVLGANFMNGYNIIFDQEKQRVGFAVSDCKYEDYAPPVSSSEENNDNQPCTSRIVPAGPCTASCTFNNNPPIQGIKYYEETR